MTLPGDHEIAPRLLEDVNNLVGVISVQPYDLEIEDFRGRSDRI